MKVFSLLPLALVPAIFAAPGDEAQVILGGTDPLQSGLFHLPQGVEGIIDKGKEKVVQWIENGKHFIKQHGLTCKSVC